ncbi:MAG: hypothetical protein J6U00_05145 [Ruminococcus sp.]|uniref:hypothetical protein n=1 Tax=Ruminococcus sp. TaxID=41978 RepID=UPI001B07CFB9|nr:hypothetical protein [Ruminococcus sp.]MBO7473375.1 hypothetical protein [Ruminococcus sp.]
MVKANVKYDIKVHSVEVRTSLQYRFYRLLAVLGAVEFVIMSFAVVISVFGRHKLTLDLVLYLSIFLGIFIGSALKLMTMSPVRSFRKLSSFYPGLNYEVTVGGENIELRASSDSSKNHSVYSISRLVSARETMGYFKLNISEGGSIFFSDTDITEGNADDLRKFLSDTLGNRYTVKEGLL